MYYPKSQITTDLHTNGDEFVLDSSKKPYVGFYWKTAKEEYFTGKNPQETLVEKLIKFSPESKTTLPTSTVSKNTNSYYNQQEDDNLVYLRLTQPTAPGLLPQYSPNLPTLQDYNDGKFTRYFCKKTNELTYLEIDKDTYTRLVDKDPKLLYQLYQPFSLSWILTGNKTQIFIINRNMVELISSRQNLLKFNEYLKNDFIKYNK